MNKHASFLNTKKFEIIFFSLIVFISCFILTGCPNPNISTEINRCLFINQKIDYAKNKLDKLDNQVAQSDHYQVFEVGTEIYDFIKEDGKILKTMITYPKDKIDSSPVIIFSHGLSGSAESQIYLTRGLAKRGNIVIAPDHLDPLSLDRIGLLDTQLQINKSTDLVRTLRYMISNIIQAQISGILSNMDELNSLTTEEIQNLADSGQLMVLFNNHFSYRIDDVNFLLNQLEILNQSDQFLKGKIDFNKLVMSGHSLGGSTALCFAMDSNSPFKAFICISPASQPFTQNDLQLITKPTLYMSGNFDGFHDDILRAFNETPSTKMFLGIKDGGHIIFTDRAFLYGLGIPFMSDGEIGFTDNLPFDKSNAIQDVTAYYPEQLHDYQGKALTIIKAMSAFIDLYVNNDDNTINIISTLEHNSLVNEFIFNP